MSLDKLPKYTKCSLILLAVSINILLRCPAVYAEFGVDSFFIHAMAQSLKINGRGPWLMHFASYFGLYPFSYPSGTPFLLSAISQVSGLDIEHSILTLSMAIGILSFFSAFLLASVFFKRDSIRILVGILYSTSPLLIKYSYWTASARGLLLALMPIILWLIIMASRRPTDTCGKEINTLKIFRVKIITLAIFSMIVSFTIHYASWIVLAFIIVYIMIISIHRWLSTSKRFHKVKDRTLSWAIAGILLISSLMLIFLIYNIVQHEINGAVLDLVNDLSGNHSLYFIWFLCALALFSLSVLLFRPSKTDEVRWQVKTMVFGVLIVISIGAFLLPLSSDQNQSLMGWMNTEGLGQEAVSTAEFKPIDFIGTLAFIVFGRYGLMLFLALPGLFSVYTFKNLGTGSRRLWFLILSFILVLPFLSIAPYPLEFVSIIIVFFAGSGGLYILDNKHTGRGLSRLAVIGFVFAILVFSNLSVNVRMDNRYELTGDRNYMDDELLELSLFIKYYTGNGSFQDPDSIQTTRISALSGKEARYYYSHDFQYLIWRDVEFDKLDIYNYNITKETFNRFLGIFYRPYGFQSRFFLPPRQYYILPEYGEMDLNATDVPDLKERYYCAYGNDRVTVWLLNEHFERSVVYG